VERSRLSGRGWVLARTHCKVLRRSVDVGMDADVLAQRVTVRRGWDGAELGITSVSARTGARSDRPSAGDALAAGGRGRCAGMPDRPSLAGGARKQKMQRCPRVPDRPSLAGAARKQQMQRCAGVPTRPSLAGAARKQAGAPRCQGIRRVRAQRVDDRQREENHTKVYGCEPVRRAMLVRDRAAARYG